MVEKAVCFCLRGPLVFIDFSVALLTVPKAFLAALGKAGGASNVLPTCGVETWDLPSKALTAKEKVLPWDYSSSKRLCNLKADLAYKRGLILTPKLNPFLTAAWSYA